MKRLGLDKNTIIALWSDHGWHLGERGIWGKFTNHEIAVRSPLIFKVPEMPKPGKRATGLVETVDIYPTLAELCGLDAPDDLAGESFAKMISNPEYPGKGYAYSFRLWGDITGKTLRTDRYRVVRWADKQEKTLQVELYDHKVDPNENNNIANKYPKIVKQLLSKLEKVSNKKR